MGARRKLQDCFGLASAVVSVPVVGGDREGHVGGEVGIDEEVMMARAGFFYAGRGDAHAPESELNQHGAAHGFAGGGGNEVDHGSGR